MLRTLARGIYRIVVGLCFGLGVVMCMFSVMEDTRSPIIECRPTGASWCGLCIRERMITMRLLRYRPYSDTPTIQPPPLPVYRDRFWRFEEQIDMLERLARDERRELGIPVWRKMGVRGTLDVDGVGSWADCFSGLSNTIVVKCSTWIAAVVLLVLPTKRFVGGPCRRALRRKQGRCVNCGYILTGNVSGVCSECGCPAPSKTDK